MMFIKLTNLHDRIVICRRSEVESVFIGNIGKKGRTVTIIQFVSGAYFCVQESVLQVRKLLGWSESYVYCDHNYKDMLINNSQIESVFDCIKSKSVFRTTIVCKSGASYAVSNSVSDVYQLLVPKPYSDD